MASPYPEGGPPSGVPGGKTSLGLDANLGAMLCYIGNIVCCVGVILSIVFLVTEKENRFVKFHAFQSLLLCGVCVILLIVVEILGVILGMVHLGILATGLWFILVLIFLALWLLAGIKAYSGQWYKLPGIGDLAFSLANK
jgi:uncharacterized membrane protein